MKAKTKSKIALTVSSALLMLVLLALAAILWMDHSANSYLSEDVPCKEVAGELFPEIDWEHWRNINPDVIGWVTVPGTNINYPIVQAPGNDRTYYLYHDVYGNWNYNGVPYLDAECAADRFDSPNVTIFGHHLQNDTMFSMFSEYNDRNYAKDHQVILLQTPEWKRVLDVRYADIVNAAHYRNHLEFEDQATYETWYQDRMSNAKVVLDDKIPDHNYTFVTCSYTTFTNERTLVVASERYGLLID